MNEHTLAKKLEHLSWLADNRVHLEQNITDIVHSLRSPGLDGHCEASWQEIADALGVTRQSAWRMYVEPAPRSST